MEALNRAWNLILAGVLFLVTPLYILGIAAVWAAQDIADWWRQEAQDAQNRRDQS